MELKIEYLNPEDLTPYAGNAKVHPPEQVEHIANSIKQFGWKQPIVVDADNVVIIGHGRLLAAKELGLDTVPCVRADDLTPEQADALRLADNKTNESEWNFSKLEEELAALEIAGFDMSDFGFEFDSKQTKTDETVHEGNLFKKFLVPPFSILDARQGYWKERKTVWRNMIGDSGQERGNAVVFGGNLKDKKYGITSNNTVSVLDPVLSELVCRWFAPADGDVFDTFAGDTAFGYVSATLGNRYTGIELREEQVVFNQKACAGLPAKYICDDGRNVLKHIGEGTQDLFFSCPPYYDLEQYSDLPNDASNQETYEEFYEIIDTAFTNAIKCLKENRFAVVVCGDVREKRTGKYYRFPDDIKNTFERNGMILYNDMVLIDPVGTATIKANQYMKTRKVVKVHQNVLVFYKGDTKKIKGAFPEIEVAEVESADMEF